MADWSGVMYGFYTDMSLELVLAGLTEKAARLGFQSQQECIRGEEFILFYKDEGMLKTHLEQGYNLGATGEGCFGVEAKPAALNGIATLFEFEGDSDFEPYDINLRFNRIFYYVLVLPDSVDESDFCRRIHTMFSETLMG